MEKEKKIFFSPYTFLFTNRSSRLMQKLCQLPGWYGRRGKKEKLYGPLVSSLRPEAKLASKPEISGGRKGIFIIQLFLNTRTHPYTRQTNHYIAHLQVDYQIGTTVHIVEIRPYLWSHFNLFLPLLHHFFNLACQNPPPKPVPLSF